MRWIGNTLGEHSELAVFLVVALGNVLGRVRLFGFGIGPALGALLAGLAIGQLGLQIPSGMQDLFFLMFVFAIGLRTGPEFVRSLRSSGAAQAGLTVLLCVTALAIATLVSRLFGFDAGTAAGAMAGAMTSSTALGSAASAAGELTVEPAIRAQLVDNISTAYTLTYVLGTGLVVWFLSSVGPVLMRVNLREACREAEGRSGPVSGRQAVNSAYREVAVRAYRLPASLDGQTVADVERLWPREHRAVITRVRRGPELLDASPSMPMRTGDVVGVAGRPGALMDASNPFVDEVDDRELLDVPAVAADLVVTNRELCGRSLGRLVERLGPRGIFLHDVRRAGRSLPRASSTIVERGDVMKVTGTKAEVKRVADEVGFAVYPSVSTDLLLVTAAIVIGGLIGVPVLVVGGVALGLSVPVGVLLAGFALGHLGATYPRFAGIPDASVRLLESLGLASFLGIVGLQAGPGALAALRHSGLSMAVAATIIVLVPHLVTILVGHYLVGLHPGVLLGVCAGAGTTAPGLSALEKAADSKVPASGYGLAYAISTVLMAMWGKLIVLIGTS